MIHIKKPEQIEQMKAAGAVSKAALRWHHHQGN